jgi:tryptophan-rich sensory protein
MLVSFAACVAVCFLPALVGGLFPPGEWYAGLAKPALTPPGWVFGPVWTALYLAMGVSSYLVLGRASAPGGRAALAAFGIQLFLNGLWSYLFFGLERPGLALVDIGLLWLAILASLALFWRLRPLAGAILVPYLAWVGFAAWLNFGLWRLNP